MLVDYMDLAGQEVINTNRAAAYGLLYGVEVGCAECDSLPEAVNDTEYTTPDADGSPAPWFDTAVPESKGFLGVMGLSVAGLAQSPIDRQPVALVGDGAALGASRRPHREMVFTTSVLAVDECSLMYGVSWLSTVLRGGACAGAACDGDTMCMFACCPDWDNAPPGTQVGTAELRHLYGVGLLDGPDLGEVAKMSSGMLVGTVTFTLVAANPWVFREPLPGFDQWVPLGDGVLVELDPDEVYDSCLQPVPCLQDPSCPEPALPPLPPVPVSPCYPTGEGVFLESFISLPFDDIPEWLTTVPVLEIRTGEVELRRIIVRFWSNPQQLPCNQLDPCNACFDINLPYLPPGSILTVDGRVKKARVECPQGALGSAIAVPTLYGPKGGTYAWPEFNCPSEICVQVLVENDVVSTAAVRVQFVARQDAA